MSFIYTCLEKLSIFQKKYKYLILLITILITIFFILGVPKIQMETDFSKMSPSELDIFKLNEKITDKFGGSDVVVIILKYNDSFNSSFKEYDIRNIDVINYLEELETEFRKESQVNTVISASTYLSMFSLNSNEDVINSIDLLPGISDFFSKDYKTTILYLTSDLSGSQDKTIAFTEMINEKINLVNKPTGIDVMVTGTAPVGVTVLDILGKDAVKTLIYAIIIILFLLFITEASFSRGFLVFSPIFLGVIWTIGTMGWLSIKLSVATVGIGAMILGLGVEYGVFMTSRYREERNKGKTQEESLKVTVPSIGSSILGSGLTTIVGFLALTFSIMPVLKDLGNSLAIGIGFSLFIAIFISPSLIILFEDFTFWFSKKMHDTYKNITDKQGRLIK
ncbi:MMPL family transporter [archaeon]|nr:MMPL family transporter [archaeon]NCP79382.1 MMPL family transporter [archaeon]NCP97325.1 MMPL family transporter [archaeon]NCQ07149.1 MMPL family transporter [archaeon]NCQ50945.1 MMPL family transporter [archaeon]